ncbi:hypothetical protein AHAS_Ahas10G0114100 [Arachis hypogaea]
MNEDKEQDHEKMDQVPFSSNIEKPFVFGSATIGIEKNKDKEVQVMEGAHAGDTTWTKVERKAKDKKVFLGRHDQDKSKKAYVDKSSNYVAKGEPAMKGINGVESSLHISKGNQVLKQARNFKLALSGPLLAIGDFNEILLSSEVKGGNFVSRRTERFGALLDECGLIDLGAHGSLYTWFRHMQGNRFISKRLDRAVASDAWCFRFSESYVENLARMHSDHCPIMVRCQGNDRRVGVKLFCFQVAWSYHPNFSSVVRGAWDKGRPNPIHCLSQESRLVNFSLLGKLVWQILINQEKLWVKIMLQKYLQNRNLFAVKAMGSSSDIWKSIVHTASVLKEAFVWEVGALSKNFWFDSWLHSGPIGARVEFLDICKATLTIEDVYCDGVWHLERIYSFIPRDLREDILSLVHISASGRDLDWSWEHTLYYAKQGYLWLIQNKLNWDRNINCLWLWKKRVPAKLRLLVWLCLHDAVPTQYLRFRRHLSSSSLCVSLALTRCMIGSSMASSMKGDFGTPGSIACKACRWMVDFEYTTQNRLNYDGSVSLGDDCAGFGWVIRDSSSQWVMGCLGNSFGSSVIKMELWSIWKGLAWAWEAGLKLVVCETDCTTAFELVTSWQVPHWHLEKEVIQLIFELKLRRDWDIRFEIIPREANVLADRLAKIGSGGSGADEVHLWHQSPEVVCPLLLLRT